MVPIYWQPQTVNEILGRAAVPKFFWGGKATRALEQFAVRLNLMGVWRDSVRSQYNEATGACRAIERGTIETIVAKTTRGTFAS